MDGRRSRRSLITAFLISITPFANADGVFAISEINMLGIKHKCYAIEKDEKIYTPKHCLSSNSSTLIVNTISNPIKAYSVNEIEKSRNKDLAIIKLDQPPKGEYNQRVVSCSSRDLNQTFFLHSCTSLKKGDSGSLISDESNKPLGMHLGLIYYNGNYFGIGLKYGSIDTTMTYE